MARARNIKPSLFSNELLGTQDPLLTLLFISLWTLADREGLLEDRPLRIKAQTFPYRESLDINGYLTELQRLGFILRYEASGMALIQVLNFTKHQSPHKTEKESTLPMPTENSTVKSYSCDLTVNAPLSNDGLTAALPPDSLIPDSLIPDSPTPDLLIAEEQSASPPAVAKPSNDAQTVFWHWRVAMNHPRAVLDQKRAGVIKRALKTHSVADLCLAITGCSRSEWHMGKNDRGVIYDDIGLILRDASKIEQFMWMADAPTGDKRINRANESIRAFAEGNF